PQKHARTIASLRPPLHIRSARRRRSGSCGVDRDAGEAMRIRTLIVDDEPLARRRLRAFLRPEAEAEIVGECGNGPAAVESIRQLKPQLVFLDVQMPGMDGFEVLQALDPRERPIVVFVTAHDQYAVQAFEERALDYLLKRFGKRRFEDTMARVRERIERPDQD